MSVFNNKNGRNYGRRACVPIIAKSVAGYPRLTEKIRYDTPAIPTSMLLADGVSIDPRKVRLQDVDNDNPPVYGNAETSKTDIFEYAFNAFQMEIGVRSAAFDVVYTSDFDVPVYPFLNRIFEPLATLTSDIAFPFITPSNPNFWVDFHRLTACLTTNPRSIASIFMTDHGDIYSCPPFGADFVEQKFADSFRIVFAIDLDCDLPFPVIVPTTNLNNILGLSEDPLWYYINIFKMTMFELAAHWILEITEAPASVRDPDNRLLGRIHAVFSDLFPKPAAPPPPPADPAPAWTFRCMGRKRKIEISHEEADTARKHSVNQFVARFGDILPFVKNVVLNERRWEYAAECYNILLAAETVRTKNDVMIAPIDLNIKPPDTTSVNENFMFLRGGNVKWPSHDLIGSLNTESFIADVCGYDKTKWSNGARWAFSVGYSITVSKAIHGASCVARWRKEGVTMRKIVEKTMGMLAMSSAAGVTGIVSESQGTENASYLSGMSTWANVYGSHRLSSNLFYPIRKAAFLYGPELQWVETIGTVIVRPSNFFMMGSDTLVSSVALEFMDKEDGYYVSVPKSVTDNIAGFMSTAKASIVATIATLAGNPTMSANLFYFLQTLIVLIQNPKTPLTIENIGTTFARVSAASAANMQIVQATATVTATREHIVAAFEAAFKGKTVNAETRWSYVTLYMLKAMQDAIEDTTLTPELLGWFEEWLGDPGILNATMKEYSDGEWFGDIMDLQNGTLFKVSPTPAIITTKEMFELQQFVGKSRTRMCDALVSKDASKRMSYLICPKALYPNPNIVLTLFPRTNMEYQIVQFPYGLPERNAPRPETQTPQSGFLSYAVPVMRSGLEKVYFLQTYKPVCWVFQCVPRNDAAFIEEYNQTLAAFKQRQIEELAPGQILHSRRGMYNTTAIQEVMRDVEKGLGNMAGAFDTFGGVYIVGSTGVTAGAGLLYTGFRYVFGPAQIGAGWGNVRMMLG